MRRHELRISFARQCRRHRPRERRAGAPGDEDAERGDRGEFVQSTFGPKLKARTAQEYQRSAKLHILPRLGRRSIGEVSRADVARLHYELRNKPYQANRTLALLSKFFRWAEAHGLRPDGSNPCRHVQKYREARRERFLSEAELARLGDALREADKDKSCSPWVIAAIRLLALTGRVETKS